jgi:hypothetical protein
MKHTVLLLLAVISLVGVFSHAAERDLCLEC